MVKKGPPTKRAAKPSGKHAAKRPAKSSGKKPLKKFPPLKKAAGSKRAARHLAAVRTPARVPENAAARDLARSMADAVLEKKGSDVVIYDVRGRTSYADYLVVATGESDRQLDAMAEGIEGKLKPDGHLPLGREGENGGNWLLLDYGDVVAHLFETNAREFYDLDSLWAGAPKERVHS